MGVSLLKQQLKKVDFLRYGVAPQVRRATRYWNRARAEQANFARIDDLKTVSAERNWTYTAIAPMVIQRTLPSRTIPEGSLEILQHAEEYIRQHDARALGPDRLRLLWYAHLLSVMQYPVYETFTCDIADVFIASPYGEVVSGNFEAITQSSRINWDDVFIDRVPSQASRLPGTYVSLLGWSGGNYCHWLIDILPRVMLIRDQLADVRFLVRNDMERFQWETLSMLGISPTQCVSLTHGWHRVERLVLCHAAQRSLMPKRQHIQDLRDLFVRGAFGSEERPQPWRKIYVSRDKSRRKITNEREILPVLQAYGFERYFCEDLSFKDQVQLFNEAKYVLGPHGAGLHNDVFCEPGTVLLELYNPFRWSYCVRRVASLMELEHWFIFGKNVSPDFDMTVDPKQLEKLLSYVFGTSDFVESDY